MFGTGCAISYNKLSLRGHEIATLLPVARNDIILAMTGLIKKDYVDI
jgi:hypothetical protein